QSSGPMAVNRWPKTSTDRRNISRAAVMDPTSYLPRTGTQPGASPGPSGVLWRTAVVGLTATVAPVSPSPPGRTSAVPSTMRANPSRPAGVGRRAPADMADEDVSVPRHLQRHGVGPAVVGHRQEVGVRPAGRHLIPHLVELDLEAHR